VKVLMLGWELPPRISGGLGTACAGIVRGLVANGVEVVFVAPHLAGDEELPGARVVGADRVPVGEELAPLPSRAPKRNEQRLAAHSVAHAPQARAEGSSQSPAALVREVPRVLPSAEAELPREVRRFSIVSPLRPYMSAASYAEDMQGRSALRAPAGRSGRAAQAAQTVSRRSTDMQAAALPAAESHPDASSEAQPEPELAAPRPIYVDLQGGYGPDLFAEVERYAWAVAALAARESFDVVHAHDWMTYPAGVAAARASGRPFVAHVHASEFDRSGERADTRIRAIESEGLSAAARVVCVSRYTADLVRRHYGVAPERLRTVHNAVEQPARSVARAARQPERLVLFLGRVTFQKGPEYFLEAAARVLRVEPDVRFVLCGSGDLLPRVVERAAELGVARRVRFTGFLGREEVERVFGMADVYVMPSVSEPFGIAPLEALSREVPVIVSRQSGVAEVLKSALKVDYWDVAEMANKILALLRYPALRRALEDEGRSELGTLRWEERGERLRDIYAELVA
jgi:glycogen(starch) synthase